MIEMTDLFLGKASLTVVITNFGMASKILKSAKKEGVSGGTILLGKGVIQSKISKFLGIDEQKKEIILMVINKEIEDKIHKFIVEKFKFHKNNSGILFSINLKNTRGIRFRTEESDKKNGEVVINNMGNDENMTNSLEAINENKYEAIFVIVNRGDAKEVVEVATQNGATGGTILHGRGAGIYENTSLFSMTIEPEKEIVLLLVEKEKIEKLLKIIEKAMEIEKEGKGIIFTLPVNKALGLYKGK